MTRLLQSILLLTCGLFLVAGCSTPPSHFYLLTPLAAEPPSDPPTSPDIGLVVGPVTLPEYLLRPQIVLRDETNEIRFEEFHRWAEPLHGNFSRVLAENLSRLLNSSRIVLYPGYRTAELPWQVTIDVARMEMGTGRPVELVARWHILDRRHRKLVYSNRSVITEPVDSDRQGAMIAAQSRALARLSREIAEALQQSVRSSRQVADHP